MNEDPVLLGTMLFVWSEMTLIKTFLLKCVCMCEIKVIWSGSGLTWSLIRLHNV